MRKKILKIQRALLFVVLFSMLGFGTVYISGGLNYASGFVPPVITAINVPLNISYRQEGNLSKDFGGLAAMTLHVPKKTVAVNGTIFEASLRIAGYKYLPQNSNEGRILGNKIFRINVKDNDGSSVLNFENELAIGIDLPEIRGNVSNLGIYRYNAIDERWELLYGAYINRSSGSASFSTYSLADFAVIEGSGNRYIYTNGGDNDGVVVKGISYLADGSLIRGSNWRVYVIDHGMKRYIKTKAELSHYTGQIIFNVDDAILNEYPTTYVMGIQGYGDGALLRGPDWKIYVIDNGSKRQIRTLWELANYAGQMIHNVDYSVLAQY